MVAEEMPVVQSIHGPSILVDFSPMKNCKDEHLRVNRLFLRMVTAFFICHLFLWNSGQISHARKAVGLPLCAPPSFELKPSQLSISREAAQIVEAKTGGKAPRQQTRNLETLYREALLADRYLKQMTRSIAVQTGGKAVFPPGGGLKGRTRAEEKIEVELGGNAALLMDVARSSIEYGTVDQVYGALKFIMGHGYEVVRLKDRALEPLPSGFWDLHLNLRMPNGHIAELQLHLRKIRQFSIGEGHRLYERIRNIRSRAFREGRPVTPKEQATIDRLNCRQRRFYQEAFKEGQGSLK